MREDPGLIPLVFRRKQSDSRDHIDALHILLPVGRNLRTDHCDCCKKGVGKRINWNCHLSTSSHCWISRGGNHIYHRLVKLERRL